MSETHAHPNKMAAIVFFSVPILFFVGWVISLFFGEALKIWIVDNYETYHLSSLITSVLVIIEIWVFTFAIYIIVLGTKGYMTSRIPPEGVFILIKLKITHGKEARWNAIAMVVSGIVFLAFVGLMIYGESISYGGDL